MQIRSAKTQLLRRTYKISRLHNMSLMRLHWKLARRRTKQVDHERNDMIDKEVDFRGSANRYWFLH